MTIPLRLWTATRQLPIGDIPSVGRGCGAAGAERPQGLSLFLLETCVTRWASWFGRRSPPVTVIGVIGPMAAAAAKIQSAIVLAKRPMARNGGIRLVWLCFPPRFCFSVWLHEPLPANTFLWSRAGIFWRRASRLARARRMARARAVQSGVQHGESSNHLAVRAWIAPGQSWLPPFGTTTCRGSAAACRAIRAWITFGQSWLPPFSTTTCRGSAAACRAVRAWITAGQNWLPPKPQLIAAPMHGQIVTPTAQLFSWLVRSCWPIFNDGLSAGAIDAGARQAEQQQRTRRPQALWLATSPAV